ncbi:hypothetical protein CDL15_Pgr021817 [Punica granatum]|uniref:Aminotransferase class V domain-containing protein n=1 Tax=Punica granatum TaxID=22663 RepID=A0A218WUK8_PUNGR|nr:hypothetical protein CDL15_Pgr021817 [Punica granatum]
MVVRKKKKRDKRGLFVFPVHSRVTGARYPYLWMNMAQENGWHVLLDACALGPKDMDSFSLFLIHSDFVVSSFYKVFGENPSGFGSLFVKKSAIPILETSTSLGIVSLIPAVGKKLLQLPSESSDDISNSSSFSGPIPMLMDSGNSKSHEVAIEHERPENSAAKSAQETDEITKGRTKGKTEIKCDGLDHVDLLGMILIGKTGISSNTIVAPPYGPAPYFSTQLPEITTYIILCSYFSLPKNSSIQLLKKEKQRTRGTRVRGSIVSSLSFKSGFFQ